MFCNLPFALLDRNPDQPRKHFDQQALDELTASIAASGLLEPIIVRPHPTAAGRYLIVAGERRWRASTAAGLVEVPCRVMDLDETDAYVLSVTENVTRADMTVMEEAEAYATLQGFGKTVLDIARLFGKRPADVEGRLLLLNLLPEVRKLVDAGTIGPGLAWYVSRLQPGNQRTVANRYARGDLDARSAIEFAEGLYVAEREVGFFDVTEPTAEERDAHRARSRTTNRNLDQIDRLADLLAAIGNTDPADLAAALGNSVGARLDALSHALKAANKARATLRAAKMHSEARALVITEDGAA